MPKLLTPGREAPKAPVPPKSPTPLPAESSWEPPTLATWMKDVKDKRRWLFDKFLPYDALVLVSGHQKRAYKTWTADAIALLLASGKSFGALMPVQAGTVLYIEEEGQPVETRNRLQGLANAFQIDIAALDNLFYVFRNRVKLDDKKWQQRLERTIAKHKPTLVILDAMVYLHSADENKTNDMQAIVNVLQTIRASGASVLYLAHLNSKGSDHKIDIDEQVRGSGLFTNAYDMHLALRKYDATNGPFPIALTVRARGAPERRYEVSWDIRNEGGDVVTWAAPEIIPLDEETSLRESTLQALNKLMPATGYTRIQLTRQFGCRRDKAYRMLEYAVTQGLMIEKDKKFQRVMGPEPKEVVG